MPLLDSLLPRGFESKTEIAERIRESKNFDKKTEDPKKARTLLFFKTRRQQTWLVATPRRLYCLLDDVRKLEPHINWSMRRSKVIDDNGKLKIKLRTEPSASKKSRVVDLGTNHRGWFYTPALFEPSSIEKAIRKLIKKAMAQ